MSYSPEGIRGYEPPHQLRRTGGKRSEDEARRLCASLPIVTINAKWKGNSLRRTGYIGCPCGRVPFRGTER